MLCGFVVCYSFIFTLISFFFCKQKTAYEMRISDWSSDVCSSDLTNPAREDPEYVAAIQEDVRWLGFEWASLRHASDYFEVFYLAAEKLVRQGDAFVCDLSADEVREYRGTLTEPGRDSPYRGRSVEENLDLFQRMRAGAFADGARTLRAKIDMASGHITMRDPAISRIKKVAHQNNGDARPTYPRHDFAHSLYNPIQGTTPDRQNAVE